MISSRDGFEALRGWPSASGVHETSHASYECQLLCNKSGVNVFTNQSDVQTRSAPRLATTGQLVINKPTLAEVPYKKS